MLSLLVIGVLSGDYPQQNNYQAGYSQNTGNTQGGNSAVLNQLNQIGSVRGSGAGYGSSSSSSGSYSGSSSSGVTVAGGSSGFTTNVKDGQFQPLYFTTSQQSSSSVSVSGNGELTGAALQAEIAKLPTNAQIDYIINSANIVEIIKAIQLVISSRVGCDLKIEVLTNMLGRIRSAISMKTFEIEEIRRLLETLRDEIARLNIEIEDLLARQANIDLAGRRADLAAALARLEAAYAAFNDANNGNTDLTIQITEFNREIQTETGKIDNLRRLITIDQQTVNQIDAEIANLQRQITRAQDRREIINTRITNNNNLIDEINANIDTIRESIRQVEVQIRTAQDNVDQLRNAFQVIELEVDQINADIDRLTRQDNDINDQIIRLRLEVQSKTNRLDDSEIPRIQLMIDTLNGALPQIETQIDNIYLTCNGLETEEQLTVETVSSGIVYRVNPEEFLRYLQANYGGNVDVNVNQLGGGNLSGNALDLLLTSIFSPVWQRNYGAPFSNDPFFNNGQSNGFRFNTDGSCGNIRNNGGAMNYGTVRSISGNVIQATGHDGNQYDLNLGACSRIEMLNRGGIAQAGDQIYWRGNFDGRNSYDVASCTMW